MVLGLTVGLIEVLEGALGVLILGCWFLMLDLAFGALEVLVDAL